jgi:hypothetical protein
VPTLAAGGQCPWCVRKRVTRVVVTVSVDDRYYDLPLCAVHEQEFDRALAPWLRWATEVDPPAVEQPEPEPVRPATPQVPPPPVTFPVLKRTVYLDEPATPKPLPPLGAPTAELLYEGQRVYLSLHAKERMVLRKIDEPAVRRLLAKQGGVIRRPGKTEGTVVVADERIKVYLDVSSRLVVTVARRGEPDPDY